MSAASAPTPRLQALLEGPSRWHSFEQLEQVGSTNDVAAERLRDGAPPGIVVLADRQAAGRGRRGRTWEDAPADATSLLVSMTTAAPPVPTLVPLAAGLAVRGAAQKAGAKIDLKWPNDALADGAKCAGVLVEHHQGGIVVGIGIDVDWRGAERAGESAAWTSLAEIAGHDVDRLAVLADLLAGLDSWLNDVERDPGTMLAIYQQACATVGRDVVVTTPSGTEIEGRARGVSESGELVVDTSDGTVAIGAGDVEHVR